MSVGLMMMMVLMKLMKLMMNKEKKRSLHFTHDAWAYGGEQSVGKEQGLIVSAGID